MSKRSKRAGDPVTPRDPASYGMAVRRYHSVLRSSGEMWVQGNEEQIVALLTALRVLLVDRLLDRVVVRLDRTRFVDSAEYPEPPTPGAAVAGGVGFGLTEIQFTHDGPRGAPHCHDMSLRPGNFQRSCAESSLCLRQRGSLTGGTPRWRSCMAPGRGYAGPRVRDGQYRRHAYRS
ncbi:MAG: hypothetical protein ACJA07_004133 [Rhodococcus sp. (in: high G+C Gram-positive bacteria)]|jgi:hypothetical protein